MIESLDSSRLVFLLFSYLTCSVLVYRFTKDIVLVFFDFLYFLYAGLGWANPTVQFNYLFYFFVYYILFIVCFYYSRRFFTMRFSSYNSIRIRPRMLYIYLYILCVFLYSYFADFSIEKYFIFHKPDLSFFTAKVDYNAYQSIFNYLILVFFPFYLYSLDLLIKKKKFLPFLMFILIPLYFLFSINSYISRTSLLLNLVLIIFSLIRVYPNLKKITFYFFAFSSPIVLSALYNYTVIRSGGLVENTSTKVLLEIFYIQEFSWPIYYNDIIKYSNNYLSTFLSWFFSLPIPSFIKGDYFEFSPNFIFSSKYTGFEVGSESFNVLLMGPVNESIFYFGKYLFFLLPFFASTLFSFYVTLFQKLYYGNFILMYIVLFELPHFIRAGFSSVAPFLINGFLVFTVSYLFLSRIKLNRKS